MTFRKELNLSTFRIVDKKKILKKKYLEQSKYDLEIKRLMKHNKFLNEQISSISTKNKNIKNFLKNIINSNNENVNKNNFSLFFNEYNELLSFNNKNLKLDVDKDLSNYKDIENNINNKIENLLATKEEKEKTNFLLKNDTQRKDNFIQIYTENFKNISSLQEPERFRYLNDEIYPTDIDNYFTKYLDVFRKNLLQTTQRWNKFRNKVETNKKEIEELKKIIKNPNLLQKNNINEEQKNSNDYNIVTTEGDNDIFLLTFDEFEDDYEPGIDEQDLISTNDNNTKSESINLKNIIENETKFNKINNRNKKRIGYNSITVDNRNGNKINVLKKDLYYYPQNNFSRSIIKENSTTSSRKNSDKSVSINSISKLNFKQILFNKNAKFMKEEANDLAMKRFQIENEYEFSKNNLEDRNDMKIKDLKKDIKMFKGKIKKKRRIIKEFQKFCKEFSIKYQRYINNNSIINNI
jgi:catabolite regulation protein CreA